jgi:hypothetical protein
MDLLPAPGPSPLEILALGLLGLYYVTPIGIARVRRHHATAWIVVATIALAWIPIVWALLVTWARWGRPRDRLAARGPAAAVARGWYPAGMAELSGLAGSPEPPDAAPDGSAGAPPRASVGAEWRVAAAIFTGALGGLLAALAGSALLWAGSGALWRDGRPVPLARFCAFLALVTAYTAAAGYVARRGAGRDLAALRSAAGTASAGWEARLRDARGAWTTAVLGAVFGLGMGLVGAILGRGVSLPWRGLVVWSLILNVLLFAALGIFARWSVLEIGALRAIGRRVRVPLLDRSALAPFVRSGLRGALLWLVGSSLATALLLDVNAPVLVLGVLAATIGLAVAALLLPSAGLHERLREQRASELARVRAHIERARIALDRPDAAARDEAARLPALLAWEQRVAAVSEWPFDATSLLRFALLLLVPLGSWLGGALVEHVVDRLLP